MTQGVMELLVVIAVGLGILNLILLKVDYIIIKKKMLDENKSKWGDIIEHIKLFKREVRSEIPNKEIKLIMNYLNVEIETIRETRKLVPKKKKSENKSENKEGFMKWKRICK